MHNAPIVESGETSTRVAPTVLDIAVRNVLPAPSFATSSGTTGRNAGNTTPDVLEYAEILKSIGA